MPQFSHLKKYEVIDGSTAQYEMIDIENPDGTSPVLILKPATEKTKEYFNNNQIMALSRKSDAIRMHKTKIVDAEMMDNQREADRELFSRFIVIGWENCQDAKKEQVPFNETHCQEFMRALPDSCFDRIRDFAKNEQNFSEAAQKFALISESDAEDVAKK